jgi:hypothetical protein
MPGSRLLPRSEATTAGSKVQISEVQTLINQNATHFGRLWVCFKIGCAPKMIQNIQVLKTYYFTGKMMITIHWVMEFSTLRIPHMAMSL